MESEFVTDRLRLAVPLAALLLAVACYMAAVAFRWLAIGAEPGEGAPGEGVVVVAGLLALVGGAAYCGLGRVGEGSSRVRVAPTRYCGRLRHGALLQLRLVLCARPPALLW